MKTNIFLWNGLRMPVADVSSHLRISLLKPDSIMRRDLMRPEDTGVCLWVGYGIGKGVTSVKREMTIFGIPDTVHSGLHGLMTNGLPDVDPPPLCYERDHLKGFDDFVRWVYFAGPHDDENFLGIDFSIFEKETSGVATTMKRVAEVLKVLSRHGVSEYTPVVLLDCKMCEPSYITPIREALGLRIVRDWNEKAIVLFSNESHFCAKCGQKTLEKSPRYCYRCGAARIG